jgi:diguanylate cyclase (GGDEF)-like protein
MEDTSLPSPVTAAAAPTAEALLAMASAPYDVHAQLLKMLLPRARHVCLYAPDLRPLYQGEGMEPQEMRAAVQSVLNGPLGNAFSFDGAAEPANEAMVYTFCLRGEEGRPLAAVCFFVPGTREARPFSLVLSLVRPALEVLQRELLLRDVVQRVGLATRGASGETDVLVDLAALEGQVDDPAGLLEASLKPLEATIGALVVPDKGLAVLRTQRAPDGGDTPGTPEAPRLVSALHRHLLNYARMNQQPLVGSTRKDDPGGSHRVLSVPIRRRGQRVVGFVAFFAPPGAPAFGVRALRIGEWVARRICDLLDQRYDANTGLPMRVEFERQAELACTAFGLHQLLFLDVDGLQDINERYGLPVGDEVLLRVAEVVRRHLPRGAVAGRLDGGRLVVCLPLTPVDVSTAVAEELSRAIKELTYRRGEGQVVVNAGIGIANLATRDTDGGWHDALARALAFAEAACRQTKQPGRARVQRWTETATPPTRTTDVLEAPLLQRLMRAVTMEMPTLVAQPMLPLQGYGEPRFELLLRLPADGGELLSPDRWMPLAAEAGLLPAIDRWVVRHAIDALSAHAEVLSRRLARFAINLSLNTLGSTTAAEAFLAELNERLVATGLPPDVLVFDIPAVGLQPTSAQWTAVIDATQRLRALGCGVALDEFDLTVSEALGERSLPLTEVKLNGTQLRSMLEDPAADAAVRAMLQWCASRGLDTVAKSVETAALRLRAQELGCVYGQGYEIGRPVVFQQVLEDLSMYDLVPPATPEVITQVLPALNAVPSEEAASG